MNNKQDTQAIILLTGDFGGENQVQPLDRKAYHCLMNVFRRNEVSPGDLLSRDRNTIAWEYEIDVDGQQINQLLKRGLQLSIHLETINQLGIKIITHVDEDYPKKLLNRLKDCFPPFLYVAGNLSLLKEIDDTHGVFMSGSHYQDEYSFDIQKDAENIGEIIAKNKMIFISGNIENPSYPDYHGMMQALACGGKAICIVPCNLAALVLSKSVKEAIANGNLLLISKEHPEAEFSFSGLTGRVKILYALADAGIVLSCKNKKGEIWNGAIEALHKFPGLPLFVSEKTYGSDGNDELMKKGLSALPDLTEESNLREMFGISLSLPLSGSIQEKYAPQFTFVDPNIDKKPDLKPKIFPALTMLSMAVFNGCEEIEAEPTISNQMSFSRSVTKRIKKAPPIQSMIVKGMGGIKNGGYYFATQFICTSKNPVLAKWYEHSNNSPIMRSFISGYYMYYLEVANIRNYGWTNQQSLYVGRSNNYRKLHESPLCNPFPISRSMSREQSIQKFREHLWNKIKAQDEAVLKELNYIISKVLQQEKFFLLCWCAPQKCHASVIVEAVRWLMIVNYDTIFTN